MLWFVILVIALVGAGAAWSVHRRRVSSDDARRHRIVAPEDGSDPRIGFRKEL